MSARPAVALLFALAACASPRSGPPPGSGPLDGTPKSFVVVGYSTSYAWPAMLQEMLDAHAGGPGVYHVLNAVVGGSPVETWIAEPGSEDHARTFGAMERDFFGPTPRLRGEAPPPTVALCQQSLQFTRTRRGPIADASDREGIEIGADALETLARRLRDAGIQRVYVAMHVYKVTVEPEVGNERLALAALLERGLPYVFEGPDVWTPTQALHPLGFEEDGVHPDETGMKLMAELWYRRLAGRDAREEVIEALHARDWDVEAMMDAYRAWRSGSGSQG